MGRGFERGERKSYIAFSFLLSLIISLSYLSGGGRGCEGKGGRLLLFFLGGRGSNKHTTFPSPRFLLSSLSFKISPLFFSPLPLLPISKAGKGSKGEKEGFVKGEGFLGVKMRKATLSLPLSLSLSLLSVINSNDFHGVLNKYM
jgi:hypothetical protein